MKKTFLRFVSTALAVFMLFGSMNIGIFAADIADGQNSAETPAEEIKVSVAIDSATLATLVANSLTTAEKAVLNHAAVKKAATSLFEADVDGYVTVVTGKELVTVKAESIESDLGTWVPVSAVVDGVSIKLSAGTGYAYATEVKDIEVVYSLDVAEGSAAETLAKLPSVLAKEAKAQKYALDTYANLIDDLDQFGAFANTLKKLSVLFGEEAQNAVATLFEKCVKSDKKSLVICDYLKKYAEGGLAYYYTADNAEKLMEQVSVLKDVFNVLAADEEFRDLLVDFGDYADKIDSVKEAMNREDLQLIAVNEAIDKKGDVASLVVALAAVEGASVVSKITVSGFATVEAAPEEPEVPVDPPVDPEDPVDPPVDPEDPVDPPVDPEDPVDPPVDPEDPVDPPVDPEDPVDPPVDPEEPEVPPTTPEAPKVIEVQVGNVTFRVSYTGNNYMLLLPAPEAELDAYYQYVINGETINVPSGEDFALGEYDNVDDLISDILGGDTDINVDEIISGIIGGEGDTEIDIDDILGDLGDEDLGIWDDIFDQIFGDSVDRSELSLEELRRYDLINFINSMNAALSGTVVDVNGAEAPVMSFIPVEDANGNISIVLRVTPYLQGVDYMTLVLNISMAFLTGNEYLSIELGENTLYHVEEGFYMQTILDTFLSDGFGLNAIAKMIDAKGDIADIRNTVAAFKDVTVLEDCEVAFGDILGGKLIATTWTATADIPETDSVYEAEYPFYITFEDYDQMADTLITVDNTIAQISKYLSITGNNGSLDVTFRVPSKLTAYYLAELLVLDYADITDINNMDFEGSVNFILSLVKPLLADQNLTLDTLENTLAKAGISVNLSKFMSESDFALIRKALNSLLNTIEFTEDSDNNKKANVSETYDIGKLIDKIGGEMADIVKVFIAEVDGWEENGEGLTIRASIEDVTLEKNNVTAIVLDPSVVLGDMEDIKGTVGDIVANPKAYISVLHTTSDLVAALENAAPNTVVVLLKDVELSSDVVISNRVFLNLNGYTITGNMTAEGAVRITSSNLENCGGVNGELSGNFIITGGRYTCDVTSMLAKGYEVEDGAVENKLYSIVEDAEGNITIAVNGSAFKKANIPAVKELLVDVALDVVLNVFTMASLTIDGNEIYNLELYDLVGMIASSKKEIAKDLYSCVNFDGITNFVNAVLAEVTDFETLAKAVANDEAFASYEITTKSWGITTGIAGDDEKYLTVNLVPQNPETITLSFVVDTDTSASAKKAIVAILEDLAKTVDIDASIDFGGFGYNNGDISVDLTGKVDAVVDFSEDGRYGLIMAIAVAYARADHRAELLAAIEETMATGEYDALASALDKVSVGDFIDAVKALGKTTFANMLATLELSIGSDNAELLALEGIYAKVFNIAGRALARLDISGGYSKLLGNIRTASETEARYEFARENVKGFDVALTLVLFDEDTAFDSDISIEIESSDLLFGSKVVLAGDKYDSNYIILDTFCDGLTVGALKSIIKVNVTTATVVVLDKDGNEKADDALVCTTDRLVIVAGNNSAEYGIAILGDVNGNGKVDTADTKALANLYVGNIDGDTAVELSADVYASEEGLNGADMAKLIAKLNADTYESCLGQ